ncbi:MAG: orotate phosphoribosyltransferase [Cytophagaceae bacterium]|nr:orotate phosphoribosyltransferase [Cytophagaceae bacterium]MDW8456819.1 orotate phosphoribosyltransferase [Cytophagaceae bacterium]
MTNEIAKLLLQIDAVKFNPERPYKWASGWLSPIYCDNRLTLSYPHVRTSIKNRLLERIKEKFPSVEVIAGVATAGIPQAALLADALGISMVYVRPKPKDHGMENLIEGKTEPGKKVVVVEDLISTGSSSLKAVEALRNSGFDVIGMLAIFTYEFDVAHQSFLSHKLSLETLCTYSQLISEAVQCGKVDVKHLQTLEAWRAAPDQWGK